MARLRTTYKCYFKPNRTNVRVFTARDAARIFCYAIDGGSTHAEIEALIEANCPDRDRRRQRDQRQVAQAAVDLLYENSDIVNETYRMFLAVNAVLLALLAIPAIIRRAPAIFLLFRGITRIQTQVAVQVVKLERQIAANEAFFSSGVVALRRAA